MAKEKAGQDWEGKKKKCKLLMEGDDYRLFLHVGLITVLQCAIQK